MMELVAIDFRKIAVLVYLDVIHLGCGYGRCNMYDELQATYIKINAVTWHRNIYSLAIEKYRNRNNFAYSIIPNIFSVCTFCQINKQSELESGPGIRTNNYVHLSKYFLLSPILMSKNC
jgi:hypothetical protein